MFDSNIFLLLGFNTTTDNQKISYDPFSLQFDSRW